MYNGPMGVMEDYDHCEGDDKRLTEATPEEWAYIDGYDAYLLGASNPYKDEYLHLARAWQEGFEHAQKDELNNEPIF